MEPELTDRYDHALLGILQHVGNIQDFLNVYFGFLYRKTDFYRLLLSPQDRLGFPPGVAQNMVLKTFKTFERLAIQDHEQRVRELQDRLKKKEEAEAEIEQAPAPVEEVTVEAPQEEGTMEQEKTTAEAALEKTEGKAEGTDANVNSTEAAASTDKRSARHAWVDSIFIASQSWGVVGSNKIIMSRTYERSLPLIGQNWHKMRCSVLCSTGNVHEDFQTNPDSYNGAVRKNYLWSQDYTDIEIKVPVPKDVIKGRQVSVDLRSTSICVKVRDKDGEHTLMDGNFTHKINAETSLWSLEPGNCILISLSKCGEYWWNAVLEGEEKIDIDKINKERSMATVDDEEHAVLDRLTFDYHQKLQGKPQSHEMKVHDMLKKGWDAEGSPFRGQTFDPSMFNISPGAVQF